MRGKSKDATVERTCEVCGKEFEIPEAWLRKEGTRGRFCSRECRDEWASDNWPLKGEDNPNYQGKTEIRVCENCGKEFEIPSAWVRKDSKNEGKFCSKKCKDDWYSGENSPQWKGGTSFEPYPFSWHEIREETRERDNYRCQKCEMTQEEHLEKYGRKLPVHHIDGDKSNCSRDNLTTLCNSCHTQVEENH